MNSAVMKTIIWKAVYTIIARVIDSKNGASKRLTFGVCGVSASLGLVQLMNIDRGRTIQMLM